jgi:hypothetical protein
MEQLQLHFTLRRIYNLSCAVTVRRAIKNFAIIPRKTTLTTVRIVNKIKTNCVGSRAIVMIQKLIKTIWNIQATTIRYLFNHKAPKKPQTSSATNARKTKAEDIIQMNRKKPA